MFERNVFWYAVRAKHSSGGKARRTARRAIARGELVEVNLIAPSGRTLRKKVVNPYWWHAIDS